MNIIQNSNSHNRSIDRKIWNISKEKLHNRWLIKSKRMTIATTWIIWIRFTFYDLETGSLERSFERLRIYNRKYYPCERCVCTRNQLVYLALDDVLKSIIIVIIMIILKLYFLRVSHWPRVCVCVRACARNAQRKVKVFVSISFETWFLYR